MSVTATYLSDLSRVRISFTDAPPDADYALVERSTDGHTWTTVRGGATVPIHASAGQVDDYEFAAGVPNHYRLSYVDTSPPSLLSVGTGVAGDNEDLTPDMPPVVADGDLMLLFASARDTGAADAPAGWTVITTFGNLSVFGRAYQSGDTAPTVTFSGGAEGDTTLAQIAAFRNTATALSALGQLSTAGPGIGYPPITTPAGARLMLLLGWKQAEVFGAVPPEATGVVGSVSSAAGTGASQLWFSQNVAPGTSYNAGTINLVMDVAAISRGLIITFAQLAHLAQDTTTLTPTPAGIWLKNPSRPSTNTPVTVTDWSDITRPARSGVFDVVGRTLPVVVTDLHGSRRFTLTITTGDLAAAADMDQRLATGEVLFLQPPGPDCPVPGPLYAAVGDITQSRHSKRTRRRFFDLPLIECAAPGPTVLGDTYLWADVVSSYATWADVQTAVTTWANLQQKLVDRDVIVP